MCSFNHSHESSKRTFLPFFLIGIVTINCLVSFHGAYANKSRFNWLGAGSYAVYSINKTKGSAWFGFDDCASTVDVTGNYSWRCIETNDDHAKLIVEANFTINSSVYYYGREFLEKAQNGDLSFIKRIPMEQVVGKILLEEDMVRVRIPGPLYIYNNTVVTVDLNTMEVVDENSKPWGKWAMWIDSLKYPLEGYTLETFIVNWLNMTVELYVSYNNGTSGPPIDTVLGRFERYFVAGHPPIENEFLLRLRIMNQPFLLLTYEYDPRTGILLHSELGYYLDDILTQRLGIIFADGFTLLETNVSIEQSGEFDFTPFIPYIAVVAISGITIVTYLIKTLRKRKQTQKYRGQNLHSLRAPHKNMPPNSAHPLDLHRYRSKRPPTNTFYLFIEGAVG